MVFASLTYAKNSKDLELASNFSKNALAKFVSGGNSYTMLIFTAWVFSVYLRLTAWVFSVYFPFNTILNKQSDIMGPTTGFQLLGLSFLLTSTLGLARVLRDTSDKANFLNFPKGDQTREHLDQVIALAKSSTLFVIVNVIALGKKPSSHHYFLTIAKNKNSDSSNRLSVYLCDNYTLLI